jgi:hippurate hydrolase
MSYLLNALSARAGEFIALRRDIHQHPELPFEEHRTSSLVARKLADWGYTVERGIGGTGVVGQLVRGRGGKRLGLRADMDALPVQESTGLPWASAKAGVMHACGHDGHTAMLLAAARHIAEDVDFHGTLNLIFQPAEESAGGALRMIEDGLFERFPCDAVFAMHNYPGIPQGHIVFRSGAMMASSDYATVTLNGVGGHGAMPQTTADPVVAGAAIIMAMQTVVSRNVDPRQTAVVTVGSIRAGHANNVIPDQAVLEIGVRAVDREVRSLLEQRVQDLVRLQAQSFGVQAHIDWRQGYPVLVNSDAETDFAFEVAHDLLGAQRVTRQGPPITASEDFAFMLERVPGSYFLIGNGAEGNPGACMVHHPGYDFNDDNVAIGSALWSSLVARFLTLSDQ